jgi:hypothetical protein
MLVVVTPEVARRQVVELRWNDWKGRARARVSAATVVDPTLMVLVVVDDSSSVRTERKSAGPAMYNLVPLGESTREAPAFPEMPPTATFRSACVDVKSTHEYCPVGSPVTTSNVMVQSFPTEEVEQSPLPHVVEYRCVPLGETASLARANGRETLPLRVAMAFCPNPRENRVLVLDVFVRFWPRR